MDGNISKIQSLLNLGLESTRNLTDGYYLLDNNGRLVTFTGIEKEENANYKGIDLSHRSYFQIPKQNETPYLEPIPKLSSYKLLCCLLVAQDQDSSCPSFHIL